MNYFSVYQQGTSFCSIFRNHVLFHEVLSIFNVQQQLIVRITKGALGLETFQSSTLVANNVDNTSKRPQKRGAYTTRVARLPAFRGFRAWLFFCVTPSQQE
jgi:hypothetical protein